MKNNSKKLIIFSLIILLILLTIILVMIFLLKKSISNQEGDNILQEMEETILDNYANSEENSVTKNAYFDINVCIAQYLNALNVNRSTYYGYNENGEYSIIVGQDEIKKNIYNVLSEVYIQKNNITIENVYEHVKTRNINTIYVPLEADLLKSGDIQSFVVHGLVENTQLEVIDELFAVINIDQINNIFSVEPIYGDYSSISEINVEQLEDTIKINDNNKFTSNSVSTEVIAKDYINIYKRLALGNPEIAYNMLDKEYRELRFQDLEGFKRHIKDNKNTIRSIRVEKYQVTKGDNYTQYVCIDQNNNYYIFKERALMQYSVMLDNYTVPTDEFTKEYNTSSEAEKVILNIKKFFKGIDDENYGYSYSVLSESFRNNTFSTETDFINYAKQNFFEENEIEYVSYEKESGVYIYKIKISDLTGKISEVREFNMIVKLDSGTDFQMSFGISK